MYVWWISLVHGGCFFFFLLSRLSTREWCDVVLVFSEHDVQRRMHMLGDGNGYGNGNGKKEPIKI